MSAGVSLKTRSLHCVVAVASAEQGGLTLKALAKRSAIAPGRVRDLLTFAAKAGLLGKARSGRQVLWMSPQNAAAMDRKPHRSSAVPRWVRGSALPDGPLRRVVRADAPLPFVCTAPRSVFEWRQS